MSKTVALLVLLTMTGCSATPTQATRIIDTATMTAIGKRVWQNEAAGRLDLLTWWNEGEAFASLGIAHFIWYPPHQSGPFEESFPALLAHLADSGVVLPVWLSGPDPGCPWHSRAEFFAAFDDPPMVELRALLASTVDQQSRFLVERLARRWPVLLDETTDKAALQRRYDELIGSPAGQYALVDYLNFKGDGTVLTERYNGEGWGLLQVLENMEPGDASILGRFADAAARTLKRRVENAPIERNESRWLPGWLHRIDGYREPL